MTAVAVAIAIAIEIEADFGSDGGENDGIEHTPSWHGMSGAAGRDNSRQMHLRGRVVWGNSQSLKICGECCSSHHDQHLRWTFSEFDSCGIRSEQREKGRKLSKTHHEVVE